jgi:hypothetical protein
MVALADIVRAAGPAYLQGHAGGLLASQRRALSDIAACRTAALGGTVSRCDTCGAVRYHYHSCRNRHCPTCQEDRAHDWLARTRARLLPGNHFLLTFTLPHQLRAVARRHQRVVYAALLREAAAAVQTLAADRQWVGGTVGILAVLHTWSRTMEYHPHAHLLVTAGALASDGLSWVKPAHARFLMPGYALSQLFRARLRDALARAGLLDAIDPRVWRRRWTVHVQQIGSGEHATLYLSRYVYRVALTNERIDRWTDGRVTFHYTHAQSGANRRVTLSVNRFLDRFLQHVLPRGFTKIRSYGLLSPGRRADLERARSILTSHTVKASASTSGVASPPSPPSTVDASRAPDGPGALAVALVVLCLARRCAVCERGLISTVSLMRHHAPRAPP